METLKEFWYNRINPRSRSDRHFVIETTLEIRCEFARIDARDGDYEKKKTSKRAMTAKKTMRAIMRSLRA